MRVAVKSLYFHQNPYTPDGERMIITTPTGLSAVNLKTRVVEKIVDGRVSIIIVGKKTGQVYYIKDRTTVYATDLKTKATREIGKLPPRTSIATVNADETLLAGIIDEGPAQQGQGEQRPNTQSANTGQNNQRPNAPQQGRTLIPVKAR
jgi:oligogalacturonide lyase